MQAGASSASNGPLWGATQRRVGIGVYGAAGLVGRELVRTLLDAAHPPTLMRLFDDQPRSLSYRERPLLIRKTTYNPPATGLAFVTGASQRCPDLVARLVDSGVRVVDVSGAPDNPEAVLVAPGMGESRVGAFTQILSAPRGPMGWLAPLLARIDEAAKLTEVVATWIAPAAADGVEELFRLRAERSGGAAQEGPTGEPRIGRMRPVDQGGVEDLWAPTCDRSESFDVRLLRRLLSKPSLAAELTTLRGDVERVDALQVHLRTARDLTQGEALAALAGAPGTVVVDRDPGPSTDDVVGSMGVEVGRVRAGVRGAGSLSFFAVGDHLLAGAVRASLSAASLLTLG